MNWLLLTDPDMPISHLTQSSASEITVVEEEARAEKQ